MKDHINQNRRLQKQRLLDRQQSQSAAKKILSQVQCNIQPNYYNTKRALSPKWDTPYTRQINFHSPPSPRFNKTNNYHYASTTQLLYSPNFKEISNDFQNSKYQTSKTGFFRMKSNINVYIPPHLNSSQSQAVIRNWKTNTKNDDKGNKKVNSNGKYEFATKNNKGSNKQGTFNCYVAKRGVNYQQQYQKMQKRIQKKGKAVNPYKNSWESVSKIKYLLDDDKDVHRMMTRPRKINYAESIQE